MKRKTAKVFFQGRRVLLLPDMCTREAVRLFHGAHGMVAILQPNGNVALSRTGIFDHPDSPRAQLRAAQCFHGLKLISAEVMQGYLERFEAQERTQDEERLRGDAYDAGFKLVKLPKVKKAVNVRKR